MTLTGFWAGSALYIYITLNGGLRFADLNQKTDIFLYRKKIRPFVSEIFAYFLKETSRKTVTFPVQDCFDKSVEKTLELCLKPQKVIINQGDVSITITGFQLINFINSLQSALWRLIPFSPLEIYELQNAVEELAEKQKDIVEKTLSNRHTLFQYLEKHNRSHLYVIFWHERDLLLAIVYCNKCFLILKDASERLHENTNK